MILDLAFFKKLGFSTKKDGMNLIEKNPNIKQDFRILENKINTFQQSETETFFSTIHNKYPSELSYWLSQENQLVIDRKLCKQNETKVAAKASLRDELIQELAQEKMESLHSDLVLPVFQNPYLENLKKKFVSIFMRIENTGKLCPDTLGQLLQIKQQMLMCEKMLSSIDKQLLLL
jgi:hypothetical protein